MAYATGPISSFQTKVPIYTDIVPVVDTIDPIVKNKKSTVGDLFKAVPYSSVNSSPALAFSVGSTSYGSGLFSPNQTQVGVRLNSTSNLLFTQSTGAVKISITDSSLSNVDLNLQAYGSGKINFLSTINFLDNFFFISSATNEQNKLKFDLNSVSGTSTLVVPNNGGTLVTENGVQTLRNKTLPSPTITGSFIVNQNTSDLVVSGGKVGIGVQVPDYKLHISGDIKLSNASPTIRLTGASNEYTIVNNNSNQLDFNLTGTGTIASVLSSGLRATNFIGTNILYNTNLFITSTGATFGFNSSGFYGVGITNAAQKLDVSGAARITEGLFRPDNANKLMDYDNNTTYHYSNQYFKSGTGSSVVNVVITSSGSVGVGKTNPSVPLEVSGRLKNDSLLVTSTVSQKTVNTLVDTNVLNLDLDSGSVFKFLLDQNINTINYNFSKGSIDNNSTYTITLIISHENNPYSINWNPNAPNSYKVFWVPEGGYGAGITSSTNDPVLQTAGPGVNLIPSRDIITLTTYDGGTTYIGRYIAALPAS